MNSLFKLIILLYEIILQSHPLAWLLIRTFSQVIDHYENPRNVGSLDKNKDNVGTGIVGAPACGDVMKLQVNDDVEMFHFGKCFILGNVSFWAFWFID